MDISYTFPANSPIRELAGKTATGGRFDSMVIAGKKEIVVRFATRIAGKAVIAKIAGKPELEALYAEHLAAEASKAAILDGLGWAAYSDVRAACINARAAYDAASKYGYPVREAEAARKAEDALDAAKLAYPGAASYALALSYAEAANYRKASAGRKAAVAIEGGADPLAAIAAMEEEWEAAAAEAVAHV